MIARLSRREKAMLYGLALFLLVVGSLCFLILPALDQYSQARATVDTLQATADETRLALLQAEGTAAAVTTLQQEVDALLAQLMPYLDAEAADAHMTGLLMDAGLRPVSLTVNAHGPGTVAAYSPDEGKEDAAPPQAERPAEPAASGYELFTCDMDTVFVGSLEAFIALADSLSGSPIRVEAASYSTTDGGSLTFSVRFSLFMAHP